MSPDVDRWIGAVCDARAGYRLPVRADVLATAFAEDALALLFPHFAAHRRADRPSVRAEFHRLEASLRQFLAGIGRDDDGTASAFMASLPAIHDALAMDAQATCDADPAATSVDEVILAYPGFYALACHRFAHELSRLGVPLLPRLVSETAHRVTGIDIHPDAAIGPAMAIDHGTGIVIGQTAVVGSRVRLYQGVTLGALSVQKSFARTKRHPTIEDDVVIYANATILGGDTVVGRGSVIGGNVWLTHSVPPQSTVTNRAVTRRHTPGAAPASPDDEQPRPLAHEDIP
jgi:serine O-acetyltransferase